jgi:hypothetical protein
VQFSDKSLVDGVQELSLEVHQPRGSDKTPAPRRQNSVENGLRSSGPGVSASNLVELTCEGRSFAGDRGAARLRARANQLSFVERR